MPETLIFNKASLITWLQNNIKDDIVCIASTSNEGLSVNTRKNTRKETFVFANDAIGKGKMSYMQKGVSIMFVSQTDVSPEALNCFKECK